MDRLLFSNLIHLALRGYGQYMWSASMAVDPYFENRALELVEKLNTASSGYVRDKAREILEKASLHAAHSHPKALLAKLTEDELALLEEVYALATSLNAADLPDMNASIHARRVRGAN
jgi:hypothetical protein